jgi:hypothetical protein
MKTETERLIDALFEPIKQLLKEAFEIGDSQNELIKQQEKQIETLLNKLEHAQIGK